MIEAGAGFGRVCSIWIQDVDLSIDRKNCTVSFTLRCSAPRTPLRHKIAVFRLSYANVLYTLVLHHRCMPCCGLLHRVCGVPTTLHEDPSEIYQVSEDDCYQHFFDNQHAPLHKSMPHFILVFNGQLRHLADLAQALNRLLAINDLFTAPRNASLRHLLVFPGVRFPFIVPMRPCRVPDERAEFLLE
jgi:hypothetical protein